MHKKISYLLILLIFCSSNVFSANIFGHEEYDPEDHDRVGFIITWLKPSRVFNVDTTDPDAQGINHSELGGAFSFNNLQFEYSPIYDKPGKRITITKYISKYATVTPYFGVSYIDGVKIKDKASKRNIDGYDGVLGIEINYFKYAKPFVEYMPLTSIFIFGARFEIAFALPKRYNQDYTETEKDLKAFIEEQKASEDKKKEKP